MERRILSALLLVAALSASCRTVPEKAHVVTPPPTPQGESTSQAAPAAPSPPATAPTAPAPPPATAPAPAQPPATAPPPEPAPAPTTPPETPPATTEPPPAQAAPAPAAPPATAPVPGTPVTAAPAPAAPAPPPPAHPTTGTREPSAAPATPPAAASAPAAPPAATAPPETPLEPPPPAHPVRTPAGGAVSGGTAAAPGSGGAAAAAPSAGAAAPGTPSAASAAAATGPHEVPQYTIEQLLGSVTLADASFSPDASKIMVTGNQTGVRNAYAITVADGKAQPLTRSTTDNVEAEGYFPGDERALVSSDKGGNELTHLYVREMDGTLRDLTPGERLKATFLAWSPDERSFFASTNERDPRFFDVYDYAVDGYARKMLFKNDAGLDFGAVSPDRRYVALSRSRGNSDSDVLLYDATSGQTKNLTEHTGQVANLPQAFTPDGAALLYTTDQDNEFAYLVRYDLATGERTQVLKPNWDISSAVYSRDGRHLVVSINADGRTEIRVFEVVGPGMRPVRLPDLSRADVTSVAFSRDGTLMSFYADSSRSPRNLYVFSLATGTVRQLTQTLNPEVRSSDLVAGQTVRFRSYDGTVVPGIVYKPHAASPERKVPAVVWVHGGPGGQSRLVYNPLVQYLANRGYVVYAINNRGSGGYGKSFYSMDDRKHGEADLDDCVTAKKMLAELVYVDPSRIAIAGGSYGGYLTLAALAFRPREFAAGVDLYGVANWVRTLESIPSWWESNRQALYTELGDPATDNERLRRISPLFHAEQIERPLLVIQGANDPRVLKVESDEIVAAAKKRGTPVEYIVFPDEGHGITKRANQARAYDEVLAFLDRYVKGGGAAPVR
jgi:dipeptidyl aminopeptidase/acylaminoacyl peptidase